MEKVFIISFYELFILESCVLHLHTTTSVVILFRYASYIQVVTLVQVLSLRRFLISFLIGLSLDPFGVRDIFQQLSFQNTTIFLIVNSIIQQLFTFVFIWYATALSWGSLKYLSRNRCLATKSMFNIQFSERNFCINIAYKISKRQRRHCRFFIAE